MEKGTLEGGARKLSRIERDTLLIMLAMALLAGVATASLSNMVGILLGGGLMLANFHFLWTFSRRVFEDEGRRKNAFLAGLFFLFFLFLGAVAFVLLVLKIPLIPFFVGTLALLVSIVLNSVLLA